MFTRFATVMLTLLFLLTVTPALAVERVETLPAFTTPTSGQLKIAVAVRLLSQPNTPVILGYGQGRFSGDRLIMTVVDAETGQQLELLGIGEQVYVRVPGSDRWMRVSPEDAAIPVSGPVAPAVPADLNATISRYETPEAVEGVATNHYQIWISPGTLPPGATPAEEVPRQGSLLALTTDLFIGQADNMLRKLQSNVLRTDPELGELAIETPIVFSAINQPQTINAPPADQVQTMAAASLRGSQVPGAKALPTWKRAIVGWLLDNNR